ncbi:MAG: hypothetical protein WC612_04320 [Bdellovibrionales bacterium]|jgi:hypothetical protein
MFTSAKLSRDELIGMYEIAEGTICVHLQELERAEKQGLMSFPTNAVTIDQTDCDKVFEAECRVQRVLTQHATVLGSSCFVFKDLLLDGGKPREQQDFPFNAYQNTEWLGDLLSITPKVEDLAVRWGFHKELAAIKGARIGLEEMLDACRPLQVEERGIPKLETLRAA